MKSFSNLTGRKIAILGGGITGLTSAFYLLRAGANVTVFESRQQLGGLATFFNFGKFSWDKFYHCILTSDKPLLQLIDDVGLISELCWTETKVGFFAEQALYPMTSSLDFLRFPPLSLSQKARLGLGVLYASRIKEGRALEKILASEWLIRIFGEANYRQMWGPLLRCKLGACREEASAAFIWATISRLYSTRENNASKKERLGYVRGGYRTVVNRLVSEIESMGGTIATGTTVERVTGAGGAVEINTSDGSFLFEDVISTVPSPVLAKIAPHLTRDYVEKLLQVKYLGVVCVVLVLKRALSPFYVTNLTDEDMPFTGIIEMTNLISREETAGLHLVYLPKYTSPGDPLFEAGDDQIWQIFWNSLRRVFPDLDESQIESRYLFRERFVQPLPVIDYSELVPQMQTNVERLLVANTTQIINSTLNNNEMVKIAKRAVAVVAAKYPTTSPALVADFNQHSPSAVAIQS
jgi:protoporphyrinogen oxidase